MIDWTAQPNPAPGLPEAERGITPVAGRAGAPSRATVLKRGLGAGSLMVFVALVLWGTWAPRGTPGADEPKARVVVRQATAFEPAREPPPAPIATTGLPAVTRPLEPAQVRDPADELLETSRRAPLIVFRRAPGAGPAGRETPDTPSRGASEGFAVYGAGLDPAPSRNDLGDRLRPTPLEGSRAALIPNRHLVVTQGTPIPCVLETAMSSDVPGFVSCIVQRDVMSESGAVVLMEKGTQVVGEYRGSPRRAARRMFVLWNRAKTPTGVIVTLASPAADSLGRSGFDGTVDTHFWERFGASLLLSLVDDAGALAGRRLADAEIEIRASQGAGATAAGIAVDRSIDLPPTLTKNQGEIVTIVVARDLDFTSVYRLRMAGRGAGPVPSRPNASGRAGVAP